MPTATQRLFHEVPSPRPAGGRPRRPAPGHARRTGFSDGSSDAGPAGDPARPWQRAPVVHGCVFMLSIVLF
jgi:hypothetical protein